jgi:hypothetical protein
MIPQTMFRDPNIRSVDGVHVLIPPFLSPDIADVRFGGFLADKYINSQPNAVNEAGSAWYSVAHSGAAGSVVSKSKKGVPVWDYITLPQSMIACANRGKYWHLTTAFEWPSMAFLSKKLGTQPHGGNNNVNPPRDSTYTTETALLDLHLNAENASYYRALPGTGPRFWAHNHLTNGVYDLNGLVWEWNMGLFLGVTGTDGHPDVLANLDVSAAGSPYGRGTISGSGGATPTLTCDDAGVNWLKNWVADSFNGMKVYIAEANSGAGVFYDIADTTPTTLVLAASSAPGNGTATFVIVRHVSVDITAGMTSGNHGILTLRDADADLKPFAIPATSDGTGSANYGNDGYWRSASSLRAALRGGAFLDASTAGVFALVLDRSPSNSYSYIGFRASKAL